MKLILKDALVAEINKRIIDAPINNIGHQRVWAYNDVKDIINTFEEKEVDLKKELEKEWDKFLENGDIGYKEVAKHFFELGLQVSSNISIEVTSIDEELKENGIDPNSKEAKIIKESYYTAIEKLSAQKGE